MVTVAPLKLPIPPPSPTEAEFPVTEAYLSATVALPVALEIPPA